MWTGGERGCNVLPGPVDRQTYVLFVAIRKLQDGVRRIDPTGRLHRPAEDKEPVRMARDVVDLTDEGTLHGLLPVACTIAPDALARSCLESISSVASLSIASDSAICNAFVVARN